MTAPGVFYPRGADSAEERLRYYASRFRVVEVDSTYYALPSKRTAESWVERTPEGFVFDIKAHALMTGQPTELSRLPKAIKEELPALFKTLRDQDDLVRALSENSIWQVWSRSGDPKVDGLFAVGVEHMNHGQGQAAIDTFSEIIRLKPDFAEGWNKRATVYFLIGDYDKSLHDCDEVVKRNPQHWGALSGYGQIYLQLDKPERALEYFERALKVNPNLQSVEAATRELRRQLFEKRKGTI